VVLEEGKPVGWITLLVQSWVHGIAEIGFSLTTSAQGRGLMVQAMELLLPTIFLGTTLERLEARCTLDNLRSQRVLERLGFVREGRLRSYFVLEGRRVDNYLYALLRPEFLAQRGLAPGVAREQGPPPNS
jgi:ribosomal-protein-alanine N-acetyltransferase